MNSLLYKHSLASEKGFTLIELIVALALGLIISAAALQLFTGGLITTRMQDASAELQDSGVFGLEYIARDIRLANYNNTNNLELTDQTTQGGIVLSSGLANANLALDGVDAGLLSQSAGSSNVAGTSDQLTIQYISPDRRFNCEGERVEAGDYVIQRYFLRRDATAGAGVNDLVLACAANTPIDSTVSIAGLTPTTIGEVIMPRVDQLRFYLGTTTEITTAAGATANRFSYYTITQYIAAANAARAAGTNVPRIISVKIDALVRSRDSTGSQDINLAQTFPFMDGNVTPSDTTTRYMRKMYSTTVAIRNGFGESL